MSKNFKKTRVSRKPTLPPEIATEVDQLSVLLKAIKGNCIVFALYHSVPDRDLVVGQLKKRIPGAIRELFFSEKRKDVIGLLTSLDGRQRNKNQGIFLYDLERTFPESLGNLNLQRETLAEIPHPLVFWIREFALREIAQQAPDFWAWRSEVFDFRLAQPELADPTVKGYLDERSFYHKTREDLDRRISLFQEVLQQHEREEASDKNMMAFLSDKLAEMCYYLSDFDLAWKYWEKSLNIYQDSGDHAGLARCYGNQALILKAWGQLDQALELFEKVEKIFTKLGDRAGLATCYGNKALIFQTWGKLDDTMALHQKEEQILVEVDDRGGLATCYGNQAVILSGRGKLDDAMKLYQKEEQICDELGDRVGLATVYGNQALILSTWGKLDQAIALHQKQEKIQKELGDIAGLASSYSGQGLILCAQGKLEEALNLFKKEEQICADLGNHAGLARTWWNQGNIHGIKGDKKKQKELWRKSIEANKAIGIPTEEYEKALAEL